MSDRAAVAVLEGERAIENLQVLLLFAALSADARWFASEQLHALRTALAAQRTVVGLRPKQVLEPAA